MLAGFAQNAAKTAEPSTNTKKRPWGSVEVVLWVGCTIMPSPKGGTQTLADELARLPSRSGGRRIGCLARIAPQWQRSTLRVSQPRRASPKSSLPGQARCPSLCTESFGAWAPGRSRMLRRASSFWKFKRVYAFGKGDPLWSPRSSGRHLPRRARFLFCPPHPDNARRLLRKSASAFRSSWSTLSAPLLPNINRNA
jgi:hypothetical protein